MSLKPFWHCRWTWGVLLLALALRIWGLAHELPWHVHWDEYRFYRNLYQVATHQGHPLDQLNPPLYTYTWGAAMAPAALILGPRGLVDAYTTHPTLFYLSGRGLSVLFGLFSIILLGRLAERRFGPQARIPAMLLLAADPSHILECQYATSTSMGLWTFLWAFSAALQAAEEGSLKAVLKAGALCGLAAGVKYNGGFALVLLLAMLLQAGAWRRMPAAVLACGAAFLLSDPWALLDPGDFLHWLDVQSRQTGPAVFGFGDAPETSLVARLWAWGGALPLLILLATPFLLGWALLKLKDLRWPAGLAAAYALFMACRAYPQFRYLLLASVLLYLLAAGALVSWKPRHVLWLLLALLLPSLTFSGLRGRLKSRPAPFQQAAAWMRENLPEDTGVACDDPVFLRRLPTADMDTFENGKKRHLLEAWRKAQGGRLWRVPIPYPDLGLFSVDLEEYRRQRVDIFVLSGMGSARIPLPERFRKEALLLVHFSPMKDRSVPAPTRDFGMSGFYNSFEGLGSLDSWGTDVWIYRWPVKP